jgi:predicted nucleic acid-binding protein
VKVPASLSGLIASGLLTICDPQNQQELDRFTHYATLFRSDGESMCLALAEQRGWVVATDDRRAIRVAQQAGLTVVSCPQLLKTWADATTPDQATLLRVLQNIEILAQFKPNTSMPEYPWWVDQLARASP